MPTRRPINQTPEDTEVIDRTGSGGGGGLVGSTGEPKLSFGGTPDFEEYVPGGDIDGEEGGGHDPAGRGGQRPSAALPTDVSRIPLSSGGAGGGLPVPMPVPSMPQEPTPIAGQRPSPMVGLSSNAGGLMGGGIPVGGLSQNNSTSVLDTLMQLMRRMPGR